MALSDASMGIVVLPTVLSTSRTLSKFAIDLDKQPALIEHLTRRQSTTGGEASEGRITLVESAANTIREAFKKCLGDRSGGPGGVDDNGRPAGKKVGVYMTANLCLKLFFQVSYYGAW